MSSSRELLVVAPIPPELERRLAADFTLLKHKPEPAERLPHTILVTTSMAGASAEMMDALPDLRLIACNGTGLDLIDLVAAEARGITVQNTPDVVTEDTADFAIGLIYAALRRIPEADRFVRAGRWRSERMTPARRVFSRRLGIVGLGKIGKAVARRAAGLGMSVAYTARSPKPDLPYDFHPSAEALAREVDILVLCCSGGPETAGLVNGAVLDALGPQGFLINVSRGSVVDEAALLDALTAGRLAGAGLDVFSNEPGIDERFFALENVVLQPHYATVTAEAREAMADILHGAISHQFAALP